MCVKLEKGSRKACSSVGAIRLAKKPGSFPWQQNRGRSAIRTLLPVLPHFLHWEKVSNNKQRLNETVFENLHSHACVTVNFYLIAYHGAVDGGELAVNSIRQPYGETD